MQGCEIKTGVNGLKLINIKKLHDTLRDELNIVRNTIANGQMQLILQEIETVLKYALSINSQKCIWSATIKFLEAWGQVSFCQKFIFLYVDQL